MPKESEVLTVREFYQLFDHKMGQVNASVLRVEEKFDRLENGRLSSLEQNVSEVKADVANIQGRAMMIPTIVSIALGSFFTIINFVLNKNS